jgi:hypothetical protein
MDGILWHIGYTGGVWYPWQSTGGTVVGEPTVVSPGTGRLDIFGRGAGNDVRWISYGPGGWSSWTSLGGYITADPSAVVTGGGQEDVFVRGSDNAAWYTSGNGSSWTSFRYLGGIAASAVLGVAPGSASLDAFVAGTDHGLWQNPMTTWYGEGGAVYADPVGTGTGGGAMCVVAENLNGDWSAWSSSAGSATWADLGTF